MTHRIQLRGGAVALVDDEDAHLCEGRNFWLTNAGYCQTTGKSLLHRIILGAQSGQIVDHIDGDPLNNTRANLRICTHAENMRNRRIHRNNKSGHKGVVLERQRSGRGTRWRARITVDGSIITLGRFESLEDAARAYADAAHKYHGEFARTA